MNACNLEIIEAMKKIKNKKTKISNDKIVENKTENKTENKIEKVKKVKKVTIVENKKSDQIVAEPTVVEPTIKELVIEESVIEESKNEICTIKAPIYGEIKTQSEKIIHVD